MPSPSSLRRRSRAAAAFALLACCAVALPRARAASVTLQDRHLVAVFDSDTGALVRLVSKSPAWTIERRPALGISFRLHAPLPGRRDNFVLGQQQHAAEVKRLSPHRLRLRWTNLLSQHGGRLPITVSALVTLRHGALTFAATVRNDSRLMVESIDYPYLGDLQPPGPDDTVDVRSMRYDNLASDEIYPAFQNRLGYWGVMYPTKLFESCFSRFCLIQGRRAGLYVEMQDPDERYLVDFTFEQHPGVVDSIDAAVPRSEDVPGHPTHLEFRASHLVFVHPHSTVTLAPIVLQCYAGDWHAGVDRYKAWRATWYHPPHLPAWVQDVNAWQQLQVNTPEQNYAVPYAKLPAYGEACARNGIAAIQLVGWNRGGQNGGNPSLDTDPVLGTWRQLHDAIARIQARGVKMILFAKFTWADMTTSWYRKELYKYASTDPYGIPYQTMGDSYLTPTQLAAINNHRFAIMDFLSPAYRAIALGQFRKILDLGAAGWLYDEVCDRTVGKYNFARGHGYRPPGYIYAGALPLARELRAAAGRRNSDFLFAGEGPQDWLTQYYGLSYFRGSKTAVERYIAPRAPMMDAVTGFDDREKLNTILLNRYIIEYEPFNFKGRLDNFPLTLAYGKKIDALRRRYKAWLWDADFRDTLGATVTADGRHAYSVFVGAGGRRAVVVTNDQPHRAITARVVLPHPGRLFSVSPENPDERPSDGTLVIPARSAAVLLEDGGPGPTTPPPSRSHS